MSLTPEEIVRNMGIGVRRGVARALAEHKRAGRSIWVSREGKVVEIPPEQIQVPVVSNEVLAGKKNLGSK